MNMVSFEDKKNNLKEALAVYSKANDKYKNDGDVVSRKEMYNKRKIVIHLLKKYIEALQTSSREKIMEEYRIALKFFDLANKEYHPYIVTTPLLPGENPPITPFHELESVSDRLELAQEWMNMLKKLLINIER